MNYVLFNEYGELTKKHIRGVVATSNLADKVYIFFALDVSTEETAFRCEARTKRADGLRTKSILTLTVYGFDTENEALVFGTPTYNEVSEKWEVPCRELTLTDEMLGANGDLEVTISYQTVNESGSVLSTDANGIFVIKVFEAVEPAYDSEEEETLLASLLLRDLSDVTNGSAVDDTDKFLGVQSGITKKVVASAIKAYCVDDIITGTQALMEVNVTGDVTVGNDVNVIRDVNITRNLNVIGTIDAKTNKIVNAGTPTVNGDVANYEFVKAREKVVQDDLDGYKEDLADGTITVDKATKDKDGNAIDTTYLKKSGGEMSGEIFMGTTNRITGMADGAQNQDAATLANVDTKVSSHNTSETAHLFIRELIADVVADVERIEGRGKSYGELALKQSELLALSEANRDTAILADIVGRFATYTVSNGDLVYTLEDADENTHEWEYNSTLTHWIDNGAYIVSKASNTVYGKIKGDSTYLSIVAGIVQVLLSDYATKLGSTETSYTYQQVYDALSARYTKTELDNGSLDARYYTETEVDNLLTAIKQLYEIKETFTDTLVTTNTISVDDLGTCDWLLLEFQCVDSVDGIIYTDTKVIKNATAKGSGIPYLDFQANFETANGATATFNNLIDDDSLLFTVTNSEGTETLKITAYTMQDINAEDVVYSNVESGLTADNVQGAIDELENEIDGVQGAIDTIELAVEQKTDKLESRQVGETTIQRNLDGLVIKVTNPTVISTPLYVNGKLFSLNETYSDGKSYITTFNRLSDGTLVSINKQEVL